MKNFKLLLISLSLIAFSNFAFAIEKKPNILNKKQQCLTLDSNLKKNALKYLEKVKEEFKEYIFGYNPYDEFNILCSKTEKEKIYNKFLEEIYSKETLTKLLNANYFENVLIFRFLKEIKKNKYKKYFEICLHTYKENNNEFKTSLFSCYETSKDFVTSLKEEKKEILNNLKEELLTNLKLIKLQLPCLSKLDEYEIYKEVADEIDSENFLNEFIKNPQIETVKIFECIMEKRSRKLVIYVNETDANLHIKFDIFKVFEDFTYNTNNLTEENLEKKLTNSLKKNFSQNFKYLERDCPWLTNLEKEEILEIFNKLMESQTFLQQLLKSSYGDHKDIFEYIVKGGENDYTKKIIFYFEKRLKKNVISRYYIIDKWFENELDIKNNLKKEEQILISLKNDFIKKLHAFEKENYLSIEEKEEILEKLEQISNSAPIKNLELLKENEPQTIFEFKTKNNNKLVKVKASLKKLEEKFIPNLEISLLKENEEILKENENILKDLKFYYFELKPSIHKLTYAKIKTIEKEFYEKIKENIAKIKNLKEDEKLILTLNKPQSIKNSEDYYSRLCEINAIITKQKENFNLSISPVIPKKNFNIFLKNQIKKELLKKNFLKDDEAQLNRIINKITIEIEKIISQNFMDIFNKTINLSTKFNNMAKIWDLVTINGEEKYYNFDVYFAKDLKKYNCPIISINNIEPFAEKTTNIPINYNNKFLIILKGLNSNNENSIENFNLTEDEEYDITRRLSQIAQSDEAKKMVVDNFKKRIENILTKNNFNELVKNSPITNLIINLNSLHNDLPADAHLKFTIYVSVVDPFNQEIPNNLEKDMRYLLKIFFTIIVNLPNIEDFILNTPIKLSKESITMTENKRLLAFYNPGVELLDARFILNNSNLTKKNIEDLKQYFKKQDKNYELTKKDLEIINSNLKNSLKRLNLGQEEIFNLKNFFFKPKNSFYNITVLAKKTIEGYYIFKILSIEKI